MNENAVTEKLAGKYFDIQRIDEHGVIHTVEKIKIKQSIRMYIIIASCGLKENNRTVYVQVRQAMYNTQFIPVNVQNYIKLTPVEQNSGKILFHSTFFDNNFIGKQYIDNGDQRTSRAKRQKLAMHKLEDADGNFELMNDSRFQVLNYETVQDSITNIIGTEMTVTPEERDNEANKELNVEMPRESRLEVHQLLKVLVDNFSFWRAKPTLKHSKGTTAQLKFTQSEPYWKIAQDNAGTLYVHELTNEKTREKPKILKWQRVNALDDEEHNSDDTKVIWFNQEDVFDIDKIEVLQKDPGLDRVIQTIRQYSSVEDKVIMNRAIRILDRINKKLKNPEEKYIDTKSFNIDKEKVKEILTKNVDGRRHNWKHDVPVKRTDMNPFYRNCCFVRFTCNNIAMNSIAKIVNNTTALEFGALITPKNHSSAAQKSIYLKVRKTRDFMKFHDDGSITFDYYKGGDYWKDGMPKHQLGFNAFKSKPNDEYTVDLPGYFNSIPKNGGRGLNTIMSVLQADSKNKSTFLYVKKNVDAIRENAKKYFTGQPNGRLRLDDIEKMYATFESKFRIIFIRFQQRRDD